MRLTWGLIDAIAEPAALDAAVTSAVALMLACGPEVIRAQKLLLRQWDELPLSQAIEAGVAAFGRAYATGEPQRFMREFGRRSQT